MFLRNALTAVRMAHIATRAALQCELALLEAIKGNASFTTIGFHEGQLVACIEGKNGNFWKTF